MNKVKISITQPNGEETVRECDAAYGCCMTRTMGEKGPGISCLSYLTGGGIPLFSAAEPMAASVVNVVGKLTEGDSSLERAMLSIIQDNISRRLKELPPEEGEAHAGN